VTTPDFGPPRADGGIVPVDFSVATDIGTDSDAD
jgi:hypothetical protein